MDQKQYLDKNGVKKIYKRLYKKIKNNVSSGEVTLPENVVTKENIESSLPTSVIMESEIATIEEAKEYLGITDITSEETVQS